MMKKLFHIALLLLCCGHSFGQTDAKLIDKIVARVGSEVVLLSEVEENYAYAKERQTDLPDDYRCIVLQSSIINKMLINQAKLDSVEVSDDDVSTQIEARIERLLSYFNQDENAIQEYYGQSINEMRESMREEMRNQLLTERMQANVLQNVTVTPAEVKQFFKEIPSDSLPYFNSEVELRELVYKPKVNDTQKRIARDKLEDIRRRIVEGGESFEELAKKYSEDPGSGRQGGDLGWQKRGTFVAEFEAAAYNLELNQLSEIVESEFGFHIIQLLGRRGNIIHTRHILIKPLITDEDYDLAETKMDSIRSMIVKDSLSFTLAVKYYGDKNVQSYNNDGRLANPRTGNTYFELGDLDYEVYAAIEAIEVGKISEPVMSTAPDGEKYYRIVELVSRSKPHRADLERDYNRIQTAALEQKKAGFMEIWLQGKLSDVYLDIDPIYQGCENIQMLLDIKKQP